MIRFVKDIFPKELLTEIQHFARNSVFVRSDKTVTLDRSKIQETCSYIKEIPFDLCINYNKYTELQPFTNELSYSVFNAFSYYMKDEFDGYELQRFHTNRIKQIEDYPDDKMTTPHYDCPVYDGDFKTILFYVITSDGNTLLFKEHGDSSIWDINCGRNISNMKLTLEHEQPPIENCALVYPSSKIHCNKPPKNNEERIVFNFVLKKQ